MRCGEDGTLLGATLSDHGYTIISMFFDAAPTADEAAAAAAALAGPGATGDGVAAAAVAPAKSTPTPGRMRTGADGTSYHDMGDWDGMCAERARNGYNSGMGEIFRKVAGIAPVILRSAAERLPSPTPTSAADEAAAAEATRPEQHEQPPQPPEPLLEEAPSRLLDEYEAAAANGHDERFASVTVDARRPASSPNPGRPQ